MWCASRCWLEKRTAKEERRRKLGRSQGHLAPSKGGEGTVLRAKKSCIQFWLAGSRVRRSLLATGANPHPLCDASFFFHQLLAGVDVAVPSRAISPSQRLVFDMAKQMQNYMYLVGDAQTRECVVVDAVYDPAGVVAAAEALGCNVTAAVATHFHYDHIGHKGQTFGGPGMSLPGLRHFA